MNHIQKLLHFVKPYWRRSLVALVLLVAVVLMDLSLPRLIQRIIDQGINGGNVQVVINTTLIMLGISALQTLFAIANNLFSIQVGEGVARDLREALFLKIQSFSFGNLDHINTGQSMVRLSSDTTAFQRMVQVSLRIGTRAPLLMIGSLILMFVTDSRLALMILPVLLATSLVIIFFVSRMGPLFLTVQKKLDRLNMVLQENIAGVRLVKAFVRADHEGKRFAVANEDFTDRNIRVMRFMATLFPAMSIFINIGMVIVIWAGRHSIHWGRSVCRADCGVHQLPADHNGTAGDHGHAGERCRCGDGLRGTDQRSVGYCPGSAGCVESSGIA